MIPIKLITVSELKKGPLSELVKHYSRLLKSFAVLDIIEVKPEKFSSPSQREKVLEVEAEKIKKQFPDGAVTIVLEADGKTYTSEKFANALASWSDGGRTLCFILGGPLGLSDKIKNSADYLLSFSPMTFPHDLARVMLLEQIYRAGTIQKGKTYHY